MKIIINSCYGGFEFSDAAIDLFKGYGGNWDPSNNDLRIDPIMVHVIEELGINASARFSCLKVIEIPDDIEYVIKDYDGIEHVAEVHRTWN